MHGRSQMYVSRSLIRICPVLDMILLVQLTLFTTDTIVCTLKGSNADNLYPPSFSYSHEVGRLGKFTVQQPSPT